MSFLQPMLLAALPLVALPIIIHLINQRRYQTVKWAAMMFLLAANRMSRGYARLRQWLIMAFRMAAIATLVFAVSRPLAGGWLGLTAGGRSDTTLILLDRSPSMQQAGSGAVGSKLETGVKQLAQTLETLGSGRWVLFESATNRPRELESPKDLLSSASTGPVSASADLPALLLAARDYIKANKVGRTEVWICSDLRENDWNAAGGRWQVLRDGFLEISQGVRFHLLAYPEAAAENLAVRVTDVRRRKTREGAELLLSLKVTRQEQTNDVQAVPVHIEIDGARSEVTLQVAGEAELKDHRIPLEKGRERGWGRVSIPADANPADNDYWFVFEQPAPRRTIIVVDDPQSARALTLAAAISPDPALQCTAEVVPQSQVPGIDWDQVSLLLWQAALPETDSAKQIRSFIERGGSAMFFPPRTPSSGEIFGVKFTSWSNQKDGIPVVSWRGDEDLLAHTASGSPLPVGGLEVRKYCGLSGDVTALATLKDGAPLLARATTDHGSVYFCATTPAPGDSSLATSGVVFYVLVQRALAAGAAALGSTRQLQAGDAPKEGATVWKRLSGAQDALSSDYSFYAGAYEAGDRLLAVNRSPAEALAPVLADSKVAELFRGLDFARVDDSAGNLSSLIQEIWRMFLVAMMIAMVGEAALCLPKLARARGDGMNVSRSLTFLGTPYSVALSIIAVLATSVFCYIAWRRSGYRTAMGLLELLRLGLVGFVAILLNQPEWIEEFRPEEKPAIAVLWDASASMDTRDALPPGKDGAAATAAPQTRHEAIARLTEDATWQTLRKRMNVVIQPFAEPRVGHGTDLNDPLIRAPQKIQNLRGVVLASDGDWNEGQPPVLAAAALRMRGVPVFAVPVGSKTRLPDVELLSVDLPTFGIAGKSVRVPFSIESSLPREFNTTVTMRASDGDEVTKEVKIAAMTRTSDFLIWKPKSTGDFTVSLTVPKHGDETLPDNNKMSAPISIRQEKLRVLVVESYPRWEYRYLRNALSRDPGVELSCLLFHPGLTKPGGGNKDYIKAFPAGRDELSRFDVVFLGDVSLDDGQLTAEQCRLLKGLVEHQASGLVFMPGMEGRELSLLDSELGDLCPVVLDSTQPRGWGSRIANHFELTELGRRSLLTKLADTQDDNAEVWEGLPGFQWYAPVLRAKAGTDVLCVHKDASNQFGRLPLLVTRTFGAGKVLFMGTDGAWRWRKGVEDKYHYRFWGQVVRWMAYQRNMAKGDTMRLYYVPDQPKLNQTMALHANVMEQGGEPLSGGEVTARITAPTGKTELVRMVSAGDEWGEFTGHFTALEAGSHRVRLFCKETGATLEASFFVQGTAAEQQGRPARPEVMEELARVTLGKVVEASKLDEVVRSLEELPEPPPLVRRVPLWCHPVTAAALIGLLGVFWVGRKVIGLV